MTSRWILPALALLAACASAPPRAPAATTGRVAWSFTGRDGIVTAIAESARAGRPVLVGLSGGDT